MRISIVIFILFQYINVSFANDKLNLKTNSEKDVKPSERSRLLKINKSKAEKSADNIFKKFGLAEDEKKTHQKKLQALIEKDQERLKKFFGNDYEKFFNSLIKKNSGSFDFSDLEKLEKDMMKNMQKFFDQVPKNDRLSNRPKALKFEWKEDKKLNRKVLVLKFKIPKDKPIDIKIKSSSVVIKGSFEEIKKSHNSYFKNSYTINESIAIPSELNEEKAQFSNIDGHINISFPYK